MNRFWRVGVDDEQIRRDIEYVTREAKLMHMRYGQPFKKSPNSIMAEIRKLAMRGRNGEEKLKEKFSVKFEEKIK